MKDRKIFIDSHVHTVHSELDGMCKIEEYVDYGAKNDFPALFISDHGNISGWVPFYLACREKNIKPVLGSEFYFSEGIYFDIDDTSLEKEEKLRKENKLNFHLNLYAKTLQGYKNIIKLTSWANLENFYRKPRITFDILKEYSKDLICTTSCVGSIFSYYINNDNEEKAREYILKFKELFKGDFYIEYGYHKFDKEKKYIEKLRRISKDYDIKTIIANDTHYMFKEDELAHKILMCKGEQKLLDQTNFNYSHNYYKSYTEICDIFSEFGGIDVDACMNNTFEIIDKVENYDLPLGKYITPELKETNGLSQVDFLKQKVKEGLKNRYKDGIPKSVIERTKYELSVIEKMGFAGYFNVVSDYTTWAKNNGIPVGPARGSGAGSLINYLIGITEVDPLKHDLIFERFLNPDRLNFPDIDLDFETSQRSTLIKHLTEQYGQKGCVPISTRGYLKGKSSIKVVASKLGLKFEKYNKLLSGIKDPTIDTVQKVLDSSEELTKMYSNDDEFKKVIDIAKKIEGSIQSISVHASAVCLENEPISNYVPIIKTKDGYATGWTDKIVEKAGLIKYDILGLSNLSVIKLCCNLIGNNFNIKNISFDDEKTYKDLQSGDNLGKFQIESNGMKSLLKRLKPENIEHISAILALYRPGSMQFIDEYIKCKNDPSLIKYVDNRLEPILKKTYGQIVYQEQVMSIARTLAGYTMAEADSLRKAIGKKIMAEMLKHEEKFINGCVENNVDKKVAETLYNQIVEFAKYSFNASHSIAYSYITYFTSYLKSNYPVQYMCALLNCNSDDLDKLNLYIGECYRLGVQVLPPDVNESGINFMIVDDKIRFGLNAIKGLGKSAVNDIIHSRINGNFKNIEDFIERTSKVDRSNIQSLLRVGAFNQIEKTPKKWDLMCEYISDAKNSKYYTETLNLEDSIYRLVGTKLAKKSDKYLEVLEKKRALGTSKKNTIKKEEYNLELEEIIDVFCDNTHKHFLRQKGYEVAEKIQNEQELLGFNVSTNPYKRWSNVFEKFFTKNSSNESVQYIALNTLFDEAEKYIGDKIHTVGFLSDIKEIKTKRGNKMAKLSVEYCGVKTSITVFAPQWENNLELKIQKGNLISIIGKLIETNKDYSSDDYEIRLDSARQMNVLTSSYPKCEIDMQQYDRSKVDQAVKKLAYEERNNFLPIEKVVIYRFGDKCMPLCGLCWINNFDELLKRLDT